MKLKLHLKDLATQAIETLCLLGALIIPYALNVKLKFKDWLDQTSLTPDNFMYYFPIKWGNLAVSIILFLIVWYFIKKYNDDFTMNSSNVYHNYPYALYWYCAKILQIPKCNLVLVPIHMQYQLVIHGTFHEYPTEKMLISDKESAENEIVRRKINWKPNPKEVNLIIEDTYPITLEQLPLEKRIIPTMILSRYREGDYSRYFDIRLVNEVNNFVRGLMPGVTIFLYATTNPKNNIFIAQNAFKNGDRSNIGKLYIYQQSHEGGRCFESFYKIY